MKFEEIVAQLAESYGQALLRAGLDPARLPKVLDRSRFTLASLAYNDLAATA